MAATLPEGTVLFDARLDSVEGKEVHRQFKGTLLPDNSLTVTELITRANKTFVNMVVGRAIHNKPGGGGGAYTAADIAVGGRLEFPKQGLTFVVQRINAGCACAPQAATCTTRRLGLAASAAASAAPAPVAGGYSPWAGGGELPPAYPPEAHEVIGRMREAMAARGVRNIMELGRAFRIMDDSHDHRLQPEEFRKAAHDYGFNLSENDVEMLLKVMDRDGNGLIDYDEFLRVVRGEMSEDRREWVRKAFSKLDANKNGVIQVDDIRKFYSAKGNPDVLSGKLTEDQVFAQFLDCFDSIKKDGIVTYQEFEEYYNAISCSIDNDEFFALLMHNAWRVD
eukprot:TRINITY_DN17008_c0_g1_i1.p1 TRINITY_DN17008_c0_g1~~TRINITY_DN17008_c0_g1_i1.p1  ORF type:complete len:346 (-),score=106.19 TRINITY_DN17008_c0_g1_i1:109-1119(-)